MYQSRPALKRLIRCEEGAGVLRTRGRNLQNLLDIPLSELLELFVQSKNAYDSALVDAYSISSGTPRGWTEERCKLYAREKVRQQGLIEPETYRWYLRARIGPDIHNG